MIMVLAMGGTLWGIGAAMGAPHRARYVMLGLLLAAVLAIQVALPDGHPLREATGQEPEFWLLIAAFVALVVGYRHVLAWMRVRAKGQEAPPVPPRPGSFSETELTRYSRHMILREIGGPGQRALKQARVLVVGAGGLGAPALLYLAAAGTGTIGVIDDDVVEGSNLQRQVIHRDARIGMPKVHSAEAALRELNPFVTVRPYNRRLTPEIAADLIADFDLVLDGTDNFDTRYLVNRVCAAQGKPLISGALSQWEGQLSVFDPARGSPCYQCVFPQAPAPGLAPSCAEAGVLGPLPGIIGAMMAAEAVKLIVDAGTPLRGRLMIHDALHAETRIIGIRPRPDCPVCGGGK